MPTIEWTINIGTIAGAVFVAGGFYWSVSRDLKSMKEELKALSKVVTEVAVQNNRLDNQGAQLNQLRDEIALLRRGQGFIQPRVDGEYGRTS